MYDESRVSHFIFDRLAFGWNMMKKFFFSLVHDFGITHYCIHRISIVNARSIGLERQTKDLYLRYRVLGKSYVELALSR